VKPKSLDHVALWVADRPRTAAAAVALVGLRVIEETDRFTLLGGTDARRGKLTLFDAEGPRERGALERIGLRVSSLEGRERVVDLGEGLELELVETETDSELDLDHVALRASDVESVAAGWEELGFARIGDARLEVGGAYLDLVPGDPGRPERPLLNHLGVLVDSVESTRPRLRSSASRSTTSSTRRTRSRSSSGGPTGSGSSTSSTSRHSA
jgi:catechol 2,3-dioxygenase-like lactoylglutathione lyase family enzyme